uniref:Reverse transcriptase domain-containing protein n=1 Tax=Tanacetum cinerariifolium TaxID=118510 RepID=A0A699H4M8_TANCI|nr:reverse transcriptase domain-containing protein [Tanacetum cinerariifolium]
MEKDVFHRLGDKEKSKPAYSDDSRHQSYHNSRMDTESCYQSSRSRRTKPVSKKHHSRKSQMPSNVKTYDGSGDPKDHLKIFQVAAKVERQLRKFEKGIPSKLPLTKEVHQASSRNSPHQAKRRGSIKDFMQRFKFESRCVKGAPECMRISRFMYGITNPELIKRLHDNILMSVDEMMRATTSFLRGEVAASNQTSPGNKNQMVPATTPLKGFSGEIIWPLGQISLLVKIGDEEHSTSTWMNFVIVRSSSPYNRIIGRPRVSKIQAVPSTNHGMLKFLVAEGILTLKSSKIIPIECAAVSTPEGQPPAVNQVIEERINEPADMTSIPRHIAELRLNIGKDALRSCKRGELRLKRSGSELHINGKIGFGTGTCQQASEKILPSTPNYSDHGPTHKANFIVERLKEDSLDTPMEVEEELPKPRIKDSGKKGCKNLQENVDSRLVANQVNETYIAKEADMIRHVKGAPECMRISGFTYGITNPELIKRLHDNIPKSVDEMMRATTAFLRGEVAASNQARKKMLSEEISHVLWEHRTMIKSNNGDTLFSLTYGTEAVISVEIGMPTLRTMKVDMVQNDKALEINLDLLEERREQAAIREAKSKAKIEKYYNSRVRNTSFKPGDLVYCSNDTIRAEKRGKLSPKWEGPYEVTKALGKGAYKLRDHDGKQLPRTWNVRNLKKCYVYEM